MYSPVLSVPARRVSGWVAETDPRYARAWLDSLPLANSGETAREIYQTLYTVNRTDLKIQNRLELMSLYDPFVATACQGLQPHLAHSPPPLGPKKRQLAEFLRRLHIEMAYGYKSCLRDLSSVRLLMRRKPRSIVCMERALHHLSEVLLRSYLAYLPYPNGVWREAHELYHLAESLGAVDEQMALSTEQGGFITIAERYVRILLLGLANPYQLPHNAAQQLNNFIAHWAKDAHLATRAPGKETPGLFLVDLEADAPPVPFVAKTSKFGDMTRVLDTSALLNTLNQFVARVDAGEPVENIELGVDCPDSTGGDLLRRMTRALGEGARRRYARRQRSTNVFVCVGVGAVHFFANGQRSFTSYTQSVSWPNTEDVAFVDLDAETTPGVLAPPAPDFSVTPPSESYRVDRWQLRDIGPQGMSVARYGDAVMPVRVGELIGVQQPSDLGRWRVAVIRWVKSPEINSIETGVEILSSAVVPVAVRAARQEHPIPALRLPAADALRRPATLVLPRGTCKVGDELELLEEETGARRVRVLRLLERTGAFEQVVFADLLRQ